MNSDIEYATGFIIQWINFMKANTNNNILFIIVIFLTFFTGCASKPVVESDSFSLTTARYGHAVVNDGKNIYVLAGANPRGFLSDIEVIDPLTGKIEVLTGRLIPRRFFSAVWDGEHSIYIFGGISVANRTMGLEKRVEIFDTITHEVRYAKHLPIPLRINSAVLSNGSIYIFGGSYLGKQKLKASPIVAVFNIAKNEWMQAADMPTAKETRAVVKDGLVYVVGGYDGKNALDVFEKFDPAVNRWESLPPLPAKISAHSVTVVKDKLFVFGNYNDLTSTYSYDFTTKKWEKINIGYKPSRHNAATTLNGTTYVIGGTTATSNSALDYIQRFKL